MTTRGRLAVAALLSIALHALVVSGEWLPLPQEPARAAAAPGAALRRCRNSSRRRPAEGARRRAAPRRLPLRKQRRSQRRARSSCPSPCPMRPPREERGGASPPRRSRRSSSRSPRNPASPPLRTACRAGAASRYTLLYGEDRTFVGTVVQSWEAGTGTYLIASEAETGGIVELFRPQRLRYVSQGRITPQGLRPESFLMSRTRRGQSEAAQARFDWSAGSLSYGLAREPKSAAAARGRAGSRELHLPVRPGAARSRPLPRADHHRHALRGLRNRGRRRGEHRDPARHAAGTAGKAAAARRAKKA